MYDSDKLGKDKSLGSIQLQREDFMTDGPLWIPLQGAKSGEILLNTDILDPGQSPELIGDSEDAPVAAFDKDGLLQNPNSKDGKSRRPGSVSGGKKSGALGDYDGPILHVNLCKGRNLIKPDMICKSDPYAKLTYDDQQDKTSVYRNTQNPEWNHKSEFIPQEADTLL